MASHSFNDAVVKMATYTAIVVRQETKRLLEREKGDKSWDDFLLELLRIAKEREVKEAIKRIQNRLRVVERAIMESEESMRREFKLRGDSGHELRDTFVEEREARGG